MTKGQRVGYFLNEWIVAVLGLSVVFAAIFYFSDKSDWQAAAWAIGVPLRVVSRFGLRRTLG
jgi:hypothetical protein